MQFHNIVMHLMRICEHQVVLVTRVVAGRLKCKLLAGILGSLPSYKMPGVGVFLVGGNEICWNPFVIGFHLFSSDSIYSASGLQIFCRSTV